MKKKKLKALLIFSLIYSKLVAQLSSCLMFAPISGNCVGRESVKRRRVHPIS